MLKEREIISKKKNSQVKGYYHSYSVDRNFWNGPGYSNKPSKEKKKLYCTVAIEKRNSKQIHSMTFSEVSEKWLATVKVQCKISTYNKYRNSYERYIKPYLGIYPISKISGDHIDQLISALLKSGRKDDTPLSHKTIQDVCTNIKQILLFADDNYHMKVSFPMKKLSIRQNRKEIGVLSPTETQALCRTLLTNTDRYKVGVLLAMYTGLRIGELCALQWKDISFENGLLEISKSLQRIQQLDNPKKKTILGLQTPKSKHSIRGIPLPETLLAFLKPFQTDGNCFLLSGTERYADPRTIQYHFKKYLADSNIENINFHVLRHTFATHCIEVGFDIKTLSEILGHSSVNITLDRYVHSSMKTKQESMNKLVVGA